MEQTIKKPSPFIAILIGLAGAASTWVSAGMFLVPGLFGYLLLVGGAGRYLLALAISAAGAVLLGGPTALIMLALILPLSAFLAMRLRRNTLYFDTALLCAAIAAAFYFIALTLPDWLSGEAVFTSTQQVATAYFAPMLEAFALPPYADIPGMADMAASLRITLRQLPQLMPGIVCLAGALMGLFNLLLCYRLCRQANAPVRQMRPFAMWQLPKSFGTGVLILAAGALAVSLLEFPGTQAVVFAVVMVAGIPFAVQGLSLVWFVLTINKRNGLMIALFVLLVLFSVFTMMITMVFVGIFEQFLHIRRKFLARTRGDQ